MPPPPHSSPKQAMNGDAETRPRTDRRASATRAGRYVVWSAADHTVSRRVWQTAPAPGRHDVGPAQERVGTGRAAGMSRLSGISLHDLWSEAELAACGGRSHWRERVFQDVYHSSACLSLNKKIS